MKKSSIFCTPWWPLIFLMVPILLMIPLLLFKWDAIEKDVAKNTTDALVAEGLEWAKVKTLYRGRHVLLSGTPPNLDSKARAEQIAWAAKGVDKVSVSADVIPLAEPASLTVNFAGNSVLLEGQLANQEEVDGVFNRAADNFGSANVENRLSIGDNVAKLPSIIGVFETIRDRATGSKELRLSIARNTLTLKGEVSDSNIKRDLSNSLSRSFKGRINNRLSIAPPPPPPPYDCEGALKEILSSDNINFESGKSKIKTSSYDLLERLKQEVVRCPDAKLEVAGHTDSVGNLELNVSLSEKRAQAVIEHLVGLGLSADQFTANGYGPSEPIADNSTREGRAKNRRIEIRLQN